MLEFLCPRFPFWQGGYYAERRSFSPSATLSWGTVFPALWLTRSATCSLERQKYGQMEAGGQGNWLAEVQLGASRCTQSPWTSWRSSFIMRAWACSQALASWACILLAGLSIASPRVQFLGPQQRAFQSPCRAQTHRERGHEEAIQLGSRARGVSRMPSLVPSVSLIKSMHAADGLPGFEPQHYHPALWLWAESVASLSPAFVI